MTMMRLLERTCRRGVEEAILSSRRRRGPSEVCAAHGVESLPTPFLCSWVRKLTLASSTLSVRGFGPGGRKERDARRRANGEERLERVVALSLAGWFSER